MPELDGLRLILAVRNLRTATDFFIDVLGFRREFGDESDGWSWLFRDNCHVGLGECPESLPVTEIGEHSYVAYITVDDVDALYAELVSRGAAIRTPPETKPWGMREFALRTPEGHGMTFGSNA